MISSRKRILVVGAGPAGLAAAAALSRIGMQVVVAEREPDATAEGAGIQLTPNGMAALDGIGIGDAVRKIGAPASGVEVCDFKTGRVIYRFELDRYIKQAKAPYLLAHRADLQRALIASAKEHGVEFKFGCEIDSNSLNSERKAIDQDSDIGETAAVVAADGGRSRARTALNPTESRTAPSHVAWRSLVRRNEADTDQETDVVRLTMGPDQHIVSYWLRERSELNVVFVASDRLAAVRSVSSEDALSELADAFGGCGGWVPELFKTDATATKWRLSSSGLPKIWYNGRTVLLGDALHPMLPFLAQGANMAFEDALELSRSLKRNPLVGDAFREYRSRRIRRLERTIRAVGRQSRIHRISNPVAHAILGNALNVAGVAFPSALAARFDWLFGKNVAAD